MMHGQTHIKFSKINSHGTHFRSCSIGAIKGQGQLVSVHAIKAYSGKRGTAPCILNLDTKWGWVVNFRRRPLYSRDRNPDTHY